MSVIDGVAEIGQYQVVVVDVGDGDGVEVGSILGIYQSGNIVKDEIATEVKRNYEVDDNDVLGDLWKGIHDTGLFSYLGRWNTSPELVELPAEYAGVLMVFRTFENVSYGLVMKAVSPIHIYDSVRNL